jgi:hypothetical protein
MRKISGLLLALLLVVTSVGCDSNNDPSDAETFVGTWALTGVSDSNGDATAAFAAGFSSVVLTNATDGSFTMRVSFSAANGGQVLTIPGTYVVNEGAKGLVLNAVVGGNPAPLAFTYSISNDNVVVLTAGATTSVLLNTLFGTSLEAPANITITRQ